MTHQPTYLFYDLETSGLNPCFDQVMQFAAIRTDLAFNELERHEFMVQLKAENIANPYAIITHGLLPERCQTGLTEYQAIQKIYQLFNTPNTISGGYNTLGFDDTFLRFSFYRHLLPPYNHQFKNGCSRFDIYPITILFYLFGDIDINWSKKNDKVSMKLENLNTANQLAIGRSHEAMPDVEATIALTQLFLQDKKMFDYALGFYDKQTDINRMNQTTTNFYIAIEGKLGFKEQFQSLVTPIGQHQYYKNQSLWLSLDKIDFAETDPKELSKKAFCIKKRAAEPPFLLPTLDRFLKKTDPEKIALAHKNHQWLLDHPKIAFDLKEHFQTDVYEEVESADIFAQLYQQPFASYNDQTLMQQFHKQYPDCDIIINQFDNPIYQSLAQRLLNASSSTQYAQQRLGAIEALIIDYQKKPALTLPKALHICDDILQNTTDFTSEQLQLCLSYKHYLQTLTNNISTKVMA